MPASSNLAHELTSRAEALASTRLQDRIIARLADAFERDARAGGPKSLPATDVAARMMLHQLGQDLLEAAVALRHAAQLFRDQAHLPKAANDAWQAAQRAESVARELLT